MKKHFVFGPLDDIEHVIVFVEGPAVLEAIRARPAGERFFYEVVGDWRGEAIEKGTTASWLVEVPAGTGTLSVDTRGEGGVVSIYMQRRKEKR